MSDFIHICINPACDFRSPESKPESECPICSHDVILALRPITDETIVLNMEAVEVGDEYVAFSAAMQEAETAETIEAERRYWQQVEEDERHFDPLD